MAAFTDIYVDPAIAGDSGAGEIAAASLFPNLTGAVFDDTGNGEGELHLSLTAASTSYTWTSGDQIYITAASAGIAVPAFYEIASKVDADAILLSADAGLTDDGTGVASDSGPFGDLEWAIEQTTFDTTNGTRVNIKAGTDEVLAANIATAMADTGTTAAWVSSSSAPCVFQGYTSVAGDGGIGGISGGGSVTIMTSTTLDYIGFIDCHIHNCGSAAVLDLDNTCSAIRCEVDNTSGAGILFDLTGFVTQCYVHNVGATGVTILGGIAAFNYLENGTNDFTIALSIGPSIAYRNIIKIDGTSDGILVTSGSVISNSIWSDGGTGDGIKLTNNTAAGLIINNIVEGFSGSGGIGFSMAPGSLARLVQYGANSAYDNATEFQAIGDWVMDELGGSSSNETLSASPFTAAATGDFAPVDTGAIKEGALPDDFGNGQ